jgi:membrane-bound lytic murein transglycosylase B
MRILSLIMISLCIGFSFELQAAEPPAKPKTKIANQRIAHGPSYAKRKDAMAWAAQVAKEQQLDEKWVKAQLAQARFIPSIPKLILPPKQVTQKNWAAYQARFIEPKRIQAGVEFWKRNQAVLSKAENTYGVPAWLIVGIIGVETFYGQHTGNFRTLDALSTLTFDFPAEHPRAAERQAFFAKELAQFLVLAHKEKIKPQSIKGSYAGAMGLPQFMPSSWAKFAVDFDGDQHIDLFGNTADVVGSVANYFKAFQWQTGLPTHYPVSFNRELLDMDSLMAPDILPTFSVASMSAKGAVLEGAALQHAGPLALIELLNGDSPPSYVAGTENFYAITRYNWSSYYAMAVIEFGQAVKNAATEVINPLGASKTRD